MKKLIALLLTAAMLVVLCSCSKSDVEAKDDEENTKTTETKESSETIDSIFGEPIEEDKAVYSIVLENVFTEGDIQPLYAEYGKVYSFAVSKYTSEGKGYLVDYEGNILTELTYPDDYSFCQLCNYTNHAQYVDHSTIEEQNLPEGVGHGGPTIIAIDEETKNICEIINGYINNIEININACIAPLFKVVTDEYEQRDIYDLSGYYGMLVDGELYTDDYENGVDFDYNGIGALCKDGKWGYFNSKGEQILPFEFSAADYLPEGYYISQGDVDFPYSSSYGYIALCKDGMWGYADLEGNMVTDFEFEEARPVYTDKAWVKIDGAWSVIEFSKPGEGITVEKAAELLEAKFGDMYDYEYSFVEETEDYYLTEGYIFKGSSEGSKQYFIVLKNSYFKYYSQFD